MLPTHFKLPTANKMARIRKTTVFCVIFLALYATFSQVEASNECYSDYDCSGLQYCCDRKYEDNVCRYSCVSESCRRDSNCAPGESCCYSDDKCATTCVGKFCTFDSHCATGESCCDVDDKCNTTCVGKSCTSDSDCATGKSCCDADDRCATTCVGKSCNYDHHCATGECCDSDYKCITGDCDVIKGLAGWIVAVIVFSVIVVIVIPIAVVVFCCCCAAGAAAASRHPAHDSITYSSITYSSTTCNHRNYSPFKPTTTATTIPCTTRTTNVFPKPSTISQPIPTIPTSRHSVSTRGN